MPLSEPNFRGRLALGGPLMATRRWFPDAPTTPIQTTSDYRHTLYDENAGRGIISYDNVNNAVLGYQTLLDEKPVLFTNAPAAGLFQKPPTLNFVDGAGFVFMGSTTAGPWIVDSMVPATAVFTQAPAAPPVTVLGTWTINDQWAVLSSGLSNQISVSLDRGATWGAPISITINGNSDIEHAGRNPIVSPDGSRCAIWSVTGIAILSDITAGIPGADAVLNTGELLSAGAFNSDGTVFVWCNQTGNLGRVFYSVDPFTTIQEVPRANNPYIIGTGGTGLQVRDICYSRARGGFFFINITRGIPGFMPETDLGTIQQGLTIETPSFAFLGTQQVIDADSNGNLIAVGNDGQTLSEVVFR